MIEIRLFKFDAKTDYLPYYKTYSLEYDCNDTIGDVLEKINAIERFSYIQESECFLRVNTLFISSTLKLSEFVKDDSAELTLEPISILRAKNDLIIDTQDYKEKFQILADFLTPQEITTLIQEKKYMLEYYASNTLAFNQDFIGEHVLLLAEELIAKNQSNRASIKLLLSDKNDGIKTRSSLIYRLYSTHKKELKSCDINFEIQQYFENFNIAFYCGLENASFENCIKETKAEYVNLQSKHFDIPANNSNMNLYYAMAGHILLEAKDNNADFLLISNDSMLSLFDAKQKKIAKVVSREIDLPVITKSEFLELLKGSRDKNAIGLSSHTIKIPFLD